MLECASHEEPTMHPLFRIAISVAAVAVASQAMAQVTFHEREGFGGRTFTTNDRVDNLERFGFNRTRRPAQDGGDPRRTAL